MAPVRGDSPILPAIRPINPVECLDSGSNRAQNRQRLSSEGVPCNPGAHHQQTHCGYQYDRQAPPSLFELLKPHFLKVFPLLSKWRGDDSGLRHFSELVIVYCLWRQKDDRYLSYSEARRLLQQTADPGRSNAAWTLARVMNSENIWHSFGKPFLLNAWPLASVGFRRARPRHI
jgi:hypothetical protein